MTMKDKPDPRAIDNQPTGWTICRCGVKTHTQSPVALMARGWSHRLPSETWDCSTCTAVWFHNPNRAELL
jgi:hypothetical protein